MAKLTPDHRPCESRAIEKVSIDKTNNKNAETFSCVHCPCVSFVARLLCVVDWVSL